MQQQAEKSHDRHADRRLAKFKAGERVILSPEGKTRYTDTQGRLKIRSATATVHQDQRGPRVCLIVDGWKAPSWYHPDFWQRIDK